MTSSSTQSRSWAFKLTSWLLLAAIAGGLTIMVWIASAVKPHKTINQKNIANPLVADPAVLLASHTPDETNAMVKPITFDAVIRDMRNYPKEFKDSRFVKANVGKWTVQVMNVTENEVITEYLKNRTTDRDKFNYFRVVDEKNQKRFILTYGQFNSSQEAVEAGKAANFNLPADIQTFPEEFKLYLTQMDEYEITPPLQDTGKSTTREVKLKTTQKPLPAPKPAVKKETNQENNNKDAQDKKPQKTSIEKSTNQQDTLNIQEKKVTQKSTQDSTTDKSTSTTKTTASTKSNTDDKPSKPQKVTPPPMSEEHSAKEKVVKEKVVKEKPAQPSHEGTSSSPEGQ